MMTEVYPILIFLVYTYHDLSWSQKSIRITTAADLRSVSASRPQLVSEVYTQHTVLNIISVKASQPKLILEVYPHHDCSWPQKCIRIMTVVGLYRLWGAETP